MPVGEDQRQHLELTRTIAEKFNKKYKTTYFKIPKDIYSNFKNIFVKANSSKILSLNEPTKKMSKSSLQPLSKIDIISLLGSILIGFLYVSRAES